VKTKKDKGWAPGARQHQVEQKDTNYKTIEDGERTEHGLATKRWFQKKRKAWRKDVRFGGQEKGTSKGRAEKRAGKKEKSSTQVGAEASARNTTEYRKIVRTERDALGEPG